MSPRPRRIHALGVALVALAAVTAACGGGETGTGAQPSPSPTSKADPNLAAMVPDKIKSDGVITIGVDASYPPNEFLAQDGKTVVGWDRELFDAVAAKLGLKTTWTAAPFDNIIPGVQSGKYEAGVSSFTINNERKQAVTMISYFTAGTQWFAKPGSGVQPDNACGKKIAVQRGTIQVDDIQARSKECTDAGKPEIAIDQYQRQDQATAAVVSGKDEAGLADSPIAAYAVKQTKGQLELLGDIYEAGPYGFVVQKESTELADAISQATAAVMKDGTYTKILQKWGVQGGAVTSSEVNPEVTS